MATYINRLMQAGQQNKVLSGSFFALPCSCCRMSKIVFNLVFIVIQLVNCLYMRMELFTDQGHGCFSGKFRGKQRAFMS